MSRNQGINFVTIFLILTKTKLQKYIRVEWVKKLPVLDKVEREKIGLFSNFQSKLRVSVINVHFPTNSHLNKQKLHRIYFKLGFINYFYPDILSSHFHSFCTTLVSKRTNKRNPPNNSLDPSVQKVALTRITKYANSSKSGQWRWRRNVYSRMKFRQGPLTVVKN